MRQVVLTINAGSSSVKFALLEIDGGAVGRRLAVGEVEQSEKGANFHALLDGGVLAREAWRGVNFETALENLLDFAQSTLAGDALAAVGHRVVHGGPDHCAPERVTPALLSLLDRSAPLAPLHLPHNVAPMRALLERRPALFQVACFDTAFHQTMPAVARRFALPQECDEFGLRRYGFHGLSYEFVARRLAEIDPGLAAGRVVVAHLGSGASLCAMAAGRSVETTMGFTTLDGLVMGTRCGALDPGVLLHLAQERGFSAAQIEDLLYRRSGLLGVSGLSSDMRTLLASDDIRAKAAIDLFIYRIVLEIGAMAAALGGLDGLVFTAGIGENAPSIRERVCERLTWLGARLDGEANALGAPLISAADSRLRIRVTPTDEEAMIARHTLDVIAAAARH